jgi:hypothetical protein
MTNRERLEEIIRTLDEIATDEAISPTPYGYLTQATFKLREASRFALDVRERDAIKAASR